LLKDQRNLYVDMQSA